LYASPEKSSREACDGPVVTIHVRVALIHANAVRFAEDPQRRLLAGRGRLVGHEGAVGDLLDQTGTEHGRGDTENQISVLGLDPELLL